MNLWGLIPLVSFLTFAVLFILVLQQAKRRVDKVFALFLFASGVWSFTSFMLVLNPSTSSPSLLFWNGMVITAIPWVAICYYHFVRAYTNKPGGIGLYIGYAFVLAILVLCLGGYVVKSAQMVGGFLYHDIGYWDYILMVVLFPFLTIPILMLAQRYRSSTDPVDRNRTMYLMTGWSILLVIGYITPLAPALKGLPTDHLGNLANALIIAYVIRRYQLLDIKLVVRRGLAYFILISALGSIYTGAILLGHSLLPDQPLYNVLLLASGLTLLLALLSRPLRYAIQERVDRFFYRGTYHYRQALLSFSSKMGNILNLKELADEMLPTISKALRITQAKLLFEDINSGDFTPQFTYPKVKDESSDEPRFNRDNPIVAWLEKETSPLDLKQIDSIPQFKGLWQTERENLVASNLELLCPIKSRGKLIGILALGRKQSKALYSQEDMQLVMSLASQAGIIVENARMFDSLKKQQLQVEQLLTQSVLAQEEERQRISVDLHDSVAQWLAGASYRAQTVDALLSGHNSDEARGELATMESTIDKSLKELRRVLTGLRPPALDELGLNHALRQSLEELKADGLGCQFSEVGTPVRLPSSMEIAVYRIVQEALSNVRKHASATNVNLRLQFQTDKLLIEVRDNGRGFDLSHTLDSAISVGHMGLLGMKQRAEMLGGDIRIRTGEGTGTSIIFSFPIQSQVEER